NPASSTAIPDDGTIHFGATYSASPVLDRPDGAAFSLSRIDLAFYSAGVVTYYLPFTGQRMDGTTVFTSFSLPPGGFTRQFYTFEFGSDWTNLKSVTFRDAFAWDNIVVDIPEPPTVKLAGAAVSLLAFGSLRRILGSHLTDRRGKPAVDFPALPRV